MPGTPPIGWQTPKTTWQAADAPVAGDLNRVEGNINAIETGSRTIDPAQTPTGNAGSLRNLLDWFANRIKVIVGETNWYDTPDTTLTAAKGHMDTAHVPVTRQVATSGGLTGGGDLQADRTLSISDAGVTDAKVGNRTVDPATGTAYSLTGLLTQQFSWIVKNIKALKGITGNWWDNAAATIAAIWDKFHDSSGHTHTATGSNGPKITATGLAAGAANDAALGNRTANPDIADAYSLTGTLTQHISWITKAIKAVKGTVTNWYDAPATTLSAAKAHQDAAAPHSGHETPTGAQAKVDAHVAASDPHSQYALDTDLANHASATTAHSATSAATANRIMMRDAAGRAQVAAPSVAADIARKDTVDAVQTNLDAKMHETTGHCHNGTGGNGPKIDPANLTWVPARIAMGSYTGDGTSDRTINVGFTPRIVFLTCRTGPLYAISNLGSGTYGVVMYYNTVTTHPWILTTNLFRPQPVTTGFTVSAGSEHGDLNAASAIYDYVAIG
jgi:hypothetical protein